MLADVQLQEYKASAASTTVEAEHDAQPSPDLASIAKAKRAYNVRITSGDMTYGEEPRQERSWEGGYAISSRSDSEERLHQPPDGIYKRLEISRVSEPIRR